MKKFIAISLLGAMSLGILNTTAIENNNHNILKLGDNTYSSQKENTNKENFVKFNVLKVDSATNQDKSENHNNTKENLERNDNYNFNDGLNANDIYPNNYNYNNLNNMPFQYNGSFYNPYNAPLNGYGYNGLYGMNYGYGYPMNNMQNGPFNNYSNNLNTYNMPTYTPSRSNLNSYRNELSKPSYSNLDTYRNNTNNYKSEQNMNYKGNIIDTNNDEIYTYLKRNENNYIRPNNDYSKYNHNFYNQTISLNNDNYENNNYLERKNPSDLKNKDNYIEQNLSKLIMGIKNLCINQDEYNTFSENYNNTRQDISSKIDEANKIMSNLEKEGIYLNDSTQKDKIMEQANRIYEKLENIENNINDKFGVNNYGLRFSNDSLSHFELYDTMTSNYPIYQEINSELDNLITLLNEAYNQNKTADVEENSTTQNNTKNNNLENEQNTENIDNKKSDSNNETQTTKLSSSNNQTNTDIKNQQDEINSQKDFTNKQYDVQKPEPAYTTQIQNDKTEQTNVEDRIQNRKQTINKYLPNSNEEQDKKQSMSYHNPYEPNNNPVLNS